MQPILCKDNALCHNSNFLSPQIFITATYRTISTRFVSLKVVKFQQKPAWNLAQSQEKRNMSKPCTMRRWQRRQAIVAERRHSAITRYASAAERADSTCPAISVPEVRYYRSASPRQRRCPRDAYCGNGWATIATETLGQVREPLSIDRKIYSSNYLLSASFTASLGTISSLNT